MVFFFQIKNCMSARKTSSSRGMKRIENEVRKCGEDTVFFVQAFDDHLILEVRISRIAVASRIVEPSLFSMQSSVVSE